MGHYAVRCEPAQVAQGLPDSKWPAFRAQGGTAAAHACIAQLAWR